MSRQIWKLNQTLPLSTLAFGVPSGPCPEQQDLVHRVILTLTSGSITTITAMSVTNPTAVHAVAFVSASCIFVHSARFARGELFLVIAHAAHFPQVPSKHHHPSRKIHRGGHLFAIVYRREKSLRAKKLDQDPWDLQYERRYR